MHAIRAAPQRSKCVQDSKFVVPAFCSHAHDTGCMYLQRCKLWQGAQQLPHMHPPLLHSPVRGVISVAQLQAESAEA